MQTAERITKILRFIRHVPSHPQTVCGSDVFENGAHITADLLSKPASIGPAVGFVLHEIIQLLD